MKSSKPLFISLSLHTLLFMLAWGALSTIRSYTEPQKIRIALLLQTPITKKNMPQQIAQPTAPTPVPVKIPKTLNPIESPKPIQKSPAVTTPSVTKPITASAAVPTVAPSVAKAPMAEPSIVKTAPPPVNVQAHYEEENLGRIRTLLAERLKYPKNALRLKQQGDVRITFTLSPSGDVSDLTVTKSSDFEMLDNAARELILSTASVFPKPSKSVRISIPIEYKIR